MSRGELAEKVGVGLSQLGYIDSGGRRPSLSVLRRIADILGLSRSEAFSLCHPDARRLIGGRPVALSAGIRGVSSQATTRCSDVTTSRAVSLVC
jgi:transcriptional regulator with XRE-family HTH domain